ncbi:hypothetical protein ARMGADRAFT_1083936 [Armillaria gallica]|uniref:Uncharacterized protein n=1 Tax=Armillaria gallica TaxID=47427 RepID=A0A2H3D5N9_ARMGA|nr:hypothetical protein ARMGADRAFT_1083936 [Armillaria gallica]
MSSLPSHPDVSPESFAFLQICQKSVTVLLVLFVSCAFGIDPSPDDDQSLPPSSEHQRTMISIVWSCLATIFACTWLSVHPNVPGRAITSKGWFAGASERVKVMIIAILAPESMVGWAADQYMVAWEVHHGTKKILYLIVGGTPWYEKKFYLIVDYAGLERE